MMNQNLFTTSECILLSLCKEIEYIKIRSKNINSSLQTCHNEILSKRLMIELDKLNKNRLKIKRIAEGMFQINSENLSIEFLFEISRRSNSLQQI